MTLAQVARTGQTMISVDLRKMWQVHHPRGLQFYAG